MSAAPDPHTEDTFTRRYVPALGRSVHRLGIAGNYGVNADEFTKALESGSEYIFWTPTQKRVTSALRSALAADREKYVVTTGPTLGYTSGSLRRALDKSCKALDTDYIDVLHLFWLGKTSAWTSGTVDELVALRESGRARHIAISIHDRERAGALAKDSPLDLFMIRYNAAHPGAEQDIFPHLHHRRPAVVAYTATAWGKLLERPPGWEGEVPPPGDSYRFALSNPHVDICLTGPSSFAQYKENLDALEAGPMEGEEMERMRAFGKAARASGGKMRFF